MNTKYKYGYTLHEWNKAKREMRKILVEKAKNRAIITRYYVVVLEEYRG